MVLKNLNPPLLYICLLFPQALCVCTNLWCVCGCVSDPDITSSLCLPGNVEYCVNSLKTLSADSHQRHKVNSNDQMTPKGRERQWVWKWTREWQDRGKRVADMLHHTTVGNKEKEVRYFIKHTFALNSTPLSDKIGLMTTAVLCKPRKPHTSYELYQREAGSLIWEQSETSSSTLLSTQLWKNATRVTAKSDLRHNKINDKAYWLLEVFLTSHDVYCHITQPFKAAWITSASVL